MFSGKKNQLTNCFKQNAGDSSVLSTFHNMHWRYMTDVLGSISETYPVQKLVAVPVGAHFTEPNGIGSFRANPSSILNYSQARLVGLRNSYPLPRAATDAVIEIVTDPKLNMREIGTVFLSTSYNMRVAMDGKEDLRLFFSSIKSVVACIFGDKAFAESLAFNFHPTCDENGKRTFGSWQRLVL
jgi:hypothetical protein